ncbi:Rho guanine nucleotide exchange factor [Stygiomarasmius scandens]|uniref:Rho guanine nucleotide exchange factor n=1 Tax=Marasmiellus scandens TaxID=2682957 RepID=A0ABR1JWP6_9AGAR
MSYAPPKTSTFEGMRDIPSFEPDIVWKQDLRKRIDGRLDGMIQEAKVLHERRIKKTDGDRANVLVAEFLQIMDVVCKMKDNTYQRELELEQARREWEWTTSADVGSLKCEGREQSLLDMILNSGELSPSADSVSHTQRKSPTLNHPRTQYLSTIPSTVEEVSSSDSGSDGKSAIWSHHIERMMATKRRNQRRGRHSQDSFLANDTISREYTTPARSKTLPEYCLRQEKSPILSRSPNPDYELWIPSAPFPPVTSDSIRSGNLANVRSKGTRVDESYGLDSYSISSSPSSSSPASSMLSRRPPTPPFHTKPVYHKPVVNYDQDAQHIPTATSPSASLISSSRPTDLYGTLAEPRTNQAPLTTTVSIPKMPTSSNVAGESVAHPFDATLLPSGTSSPSSRPMQIPRPLSSIGGWGSSCNCSPLSKVSVLTEVSSTDSSWTDPYPVSLSGLEKVQAWRFWSPEDDLQSDSSESEEESQPEIDTGQDVQAQHGDLFEFESCPGDQPKKDEPAETWMVKEELRETAAASSTPDDLQGESLKCHDTPDKPEEPLHLVIPDQRQVTLPRQDESEPSQQKNEQLKVECEKGVPRFPLKEDEAATPIARIQKTVWAKCPVDDCVAKEGEDTKRCDAPHTVASVANDVPKERQIEKSSWTDQNHGREKTHRDEDAGKNTCGWIAEGTLQQKRDILESPLLPAEDETARDLTRLRKEAAGWKTKVLKQLENSSQETSKATSLQPAQFEVHTDNRDKSAQNSEMMRPVVEQEVEQEDIWTVSDLTRLEEIVITNKDGIPGTDAVLQKLVLILDNKQEYQRLLAQRGDCAQSLLNLLQTLYGYPGVNVRSRSKICDAMIRLSKRSNLYPSCLAMKDTVKIGDYPVAAGGFGDIWKGSIGGRMACLKVVKLYNESDIQMLLKESEFLKEAILWRQLNHPNVLPFYGLYFLDDRKHRLCLVSPWMENGNVKQYLSKPSEKPIDRVALAYDVANGLSYLHGEKIVHGDLKGVNILITPSGRASVADFGLSCIADSEVLRWTSMSTIHSGGTARWLAPECLIDGLPVTYKSDIYAFGCVCYEIFTGLVPFQELAKDPAVLYQLLSRKRPRRPLDEPQLTDTIWAVIERCWAHAPNDRPTASELPQLLTQASGRAIEMAEEWNDSLYSQLWQSVQHPEICPRGSDVEYFLFGPSQ